MSESRRNKRVFFLLLAFCLLLTGCMTEEPIKQRATDQRIELIGNSSFNIDLLSAKTLINDDGLLTVDAKVLLSRTGPLRWIFCGDPKVTVWYRFTWIDSKGNTTKAPQREMVTLPGSIIDLHHLPGIGGHRQHHGTINARRLHRGPQRRRCPIQKGFGVGGGL